MSSSTSSTSTYRRSKVASFPVDPYGPLQVLYGTTATGVVGVVIGSGMAMRQGKVSIEAGGQVAFNMASLGLSFWAFREYIVSPILTGMEVTAGHSRRMRDFERIARGEIDELPTIAPTMSEVRTDRLLDSGIAGALAGAVMSGAVRGIHTAPKGASTMGLIAVAMQALVNQTRVYRLNSLAKSEAENAAAGITPRDPSAPHRTVRTLFEEHSTKANAPVPHEDDTPTLPEMIVLGLSKILPVRKISNEEYLATLEKRKASIQKRLGEIEDEERMMFEAQAKGLEASRRREEDFRRETIADNQETIERRHKV
ncbi:hypothetical protein IAT38_002615 [Cryptococcus sp. DSM 104549]